MMSRADLIKLPSCWVVVARVKGGAGCFAVGIFAGDFFTGIFFTGAFFMGAGFLAAVLGAEVDFFGRAMRSIGILGGSYIV
jgi:hypothetical protein